MPNALARHGPLCGAVASSVSWVDACGGRLLPWTGPTRLHTVQHVSVGIGQTVAVGSHADIGQIAFTRPRT